MWWFPRRSYLPGAGGSGHCQHLALLQVQADVLQDRRDVQVGEEEAAVAVGVTTGFVLLLDLLKQLADALRSSSDRGETSAHCLYRLNKTLR